jgi:dolichol-phosphate mannosyltransferase
MNRSSTEAKVGGMPDTSTAPVPCLSVVVPVCDERENLPLLVDEIARALAGSAFEMIAVDDGSRDGSAELLEHLAQRRSFLRVLRFPRNQGQSAALVAGFRASRGGIVVTLDADLQNDPADIPKLLEALESCDMVSGVRQDRRDTAFRKLASKVANKIRNWAVKDSVRDVGCSLKAYRRDYLAALPAFNGLHRFLPAFLELQGARIREIPVNHRPRRHGSSKYSINNRLWRGLHDLIGVRWLQRRWVDPGLAQEVMWTTPPFGSSSALPDKPCSPDDSSSNG